MDYLDNLPDNDQSPQPVPTKSKLLKAIKNPLKFGTKKPSNETRSRKDDSNAEGLSSTLIMQLHVLIPPNIYSVL